MRDPFIEELQARPNVVIAEPTDTLTFLGQPSQAALVLTDSGEVQEGAPVLGVPMLVLREVTERPEGVGAGVARLVGTDIAMIVSETDEVLCDPNIHRSMVGAVDLYGDGEAARRCLGALGRLC